MSLPPSVRELGKIITFYSYKGGTGRSMALANIACLLAKRNARTSQRVLVMDWDLEAPGLHRFFSAKCDLPQYEAQPGVINYFNSLRQQLITSKDLYEQFEDPEGWRVLEKALPLDDFIIPDVVNGVDFIPAGRFDPEYPKLVGSFDWIELFEQYTNAIRVFRDLVAHKFEYTLIDSRTGLTDVSGICTTLLPEKLIGVFTPNRQSLLGLCDLIRQAVEYRRQSDDFRPLSAFPLPSRVENAEKNLREQWRRDYQSQFERLFRALHDTEQCDLTDYFNEVVLPHVSYYAYGENIAVLQETSDAISLSAAYQRFYERLMKTSYAWEQAELEETASTARSTSSVRMTEKYDAFLSYAAADAKEVERVDARLRMHGVKSFFPLNDLVPGEDWTNGTLKAMNESKVAVVFVGAEESGAWHDQQSLAAFENYAKDPSKRIIPVLLPNATGYAEGRVPNFLRNAQWVDLRQGVRDEQAIGNLVWALTGKRPEPINRRLGWRRLAMILVGSLVLLAILLGLRLFLRKQAAKVTPSPSSLITQAYASRRNNNLTDAINELTTALTLNPEPQLAVQIYSDRAYCYKLSNDWVKSIEDLSAALVANRTPSEVIRLLNDRADAYIQIRQPEAALADYTAAVKLNSKDPIAVPGQDWLTQSLTPSQPGTPPFFVFLKFMQQPITSDLPDVPVSVKKLYPKAVRGINVRGWPNPIPQNEIRYHNSESEAKLAGTIVNNLKAAGLSVAGPVPTNASSRIELWLATNGNVRKMPSTSSSLAQNITQPLSLAILYLSRSREGSARQVADLLRKNRQYANVTVLLYDRKKVHWMWNQPAELHYFKPADKMNAEDLAKYLGAQGINVPVRFMNAEGPEPGYLEIWLLDK